MPHRVCRTATVAVAILFSFLAAAHAGAAPASGLSVEQRVAAQKAIEEVYWRHRIWPKDNPNPKPPLSSVMPDEEIQAKVEDYLEKANALEKWWQRPITAEQLQAELDRMTANTRDAETLRELFEALGNDPLLIAETLARQTLAERLIRNWYAFDDRFHGEVRRQAEGGVARTTGVAEMKAMGGEYFERTFVLRRDGVEIPGKAPGDRAVELEPDEWKHFMDDVAGRFGTSPGAIPLGRLSGLEEGADRFFVTAVLSWGDDEAVIASVVWPKRLFDSWWSVERTTSKVDITAEGGSFAISAPASGACVDDTWQSRFYVPRPRESHTAVWTGTEMIVWGGYDGVRLNTGGRYNPSTDSWTATSTETNVPDPRAYHTAVWTGMEMIVWGGYDGISLNTGGRYNPSTDSWTATSMETNVPDPRGDHTAVWTGTEMIVWGGTGSSGSLNTGGQYSPSTDNWTATSTETNVPDPRAYHTAVWTGMEMIVWGGTGSSGSLNTGGRYNPSTDTWTATSTETNVPDPRAYHTAVWTGTEMIVWGGVGAGYLNTGGQYNPSTDSWTATSTEMNVPDPRVWHTAMWTATEMIVWGGTGSSGSLNTGGRYNPSTGTWTATSAEANVPDPRVRHTAVWTGTEMIVWGGYDAWYLNTGGRYSPSTDSWTATSMGTNVPGPRYDHTAVWTGTEMIVWGGYDGIRLNTGGRYNPSTESWTATSMGTNVPDPRDRHTAVWTGTEMIVWGGSYSHGSNYFNSGGRYDPLTDSWTSTSTGTNVPGPRIWHTAAWTGTEMIIWGGYDGIRLNTGGRYSPSTDSWTATSMVTNVPDPRDRHAAVWTGTEMIVWGGLHLDGIGSNAGGRYDPSTDAWTGTPTDTNAPDPRYGHTAVWTGTEMIVWGGYYFDGSDQHLLNTGGQYGPSTDTWTATSPGTNVPGPRNSHTAVWTGTEMIVWGGGGPGYLNTGGRYNPSTDRWTPTSTGTNVPDPRVRHTAVWTGTRMVVWGGTYSYLWDTAIGLYCACIEPTTFYRDRDGDGYGSSAISTTTCDGSIPAGYVANSTDCDDGKPHCTTDCMDTDNDSWCGSSDCDDAEPVTHPGAPEVCDGADNNCDGNLPTNEANTDVDAFRVCEGDCDDGNADVFPGATQLCDGFNNDCLANWPAIPADETSDDLDAYTECQGDCNDANPSIHPSAPESCNAMDDDCDTLVDEDELGEDTDGDGFHNLCDNCRETFNTSQVDTDEDGIGSSCDNCALTRNVEQVDTDLDTVGNACDNCPVDYNPAQVDSDGDFHGDACDNCVYDGNTGQSDADSDREGDLCDLDDGLIYMLFHQPDYVEWQEETGFASWNIYRGDLEVLRSSGIYTQDPALVPLAARNCELTAPWVADTDSPPGTALFFLATGNLTGTGVESGLGADSFGTSRTNTNPCP